MHGGERDHSLDAARGVLMGLGLLLHTANIYSPGAGWLVDDPQAHPFFGWLSDVIHVFRMPAFFWISGYFCALMFLRRGNGAMLRLRLPRLLLPLLATLLLLNTLQDLLVGWAAGRTTQEVLAAGLHLHHLWFLVDLLVFTLMAALLLPLVQRWLSAQRDRRPPAAWSLLLLCAAGSYGIEGLVRGSGLAYQSLFGVTTPYELARYWPYFLGGLCMQLLPAVRERFAGIPGWLFLPAVLAARWLDLDTEHPIAWIGELRHAGALLATWVGIGALLGLFGRWFSTPSAFTRLVSDSAYSVYLFHHVLVVALGLLLLPLAVGPWLKFVLIVAAAGGGALALHVLLVRRVPLLRLLFNGYWPRR